jgi:hypothetical protein
MKERKETKNKKKRNKIPFQAAGMLLLHVLTPTFAFNPTTAPGILQVVPHSIPYQVLLCLLSFLLH